MRDTLGSTFAGFILLIAVGLFFILEPDNKISAGLARVDKNRYTVHTVSLMAGGTAWIIALMCVPVMIGIMIDFPWLGLISFGGIHMMYQFHDWCEKRDGRK